MKEAEHTGNLVCYWSNLKNHPKCIHGPCLLFGRETPDEVLKYYTCSACRDRKICSAFFEYGKELNKYQIQTLEQQKKKNLPSYPHQKLFINHNHLMSESPIRRMYCHTCERLLSVSELQKHNDHEILQNISDHQMLHPTEFLKPLEDSKKEAQYLFSKKAVSDIISILTDLNAENVLCIGAPRIHEHITNNLEGKMSSLLLDFDGRFHNFFGPLNYCWYNMFNHHFFKEESENIFKEFLTQSQGKNMYLVCDPPFGGRVEPISQTFKTISDLHKKLNKIDNPQDELKIFFIFPYFMEGVMRVKANPQNISGGLKDLKMTDYKVEYDNHPLFVSKDNKQQGSQVRIFTNVPLDLIKLPESDGYKYCKRCSRWVSAENKHCKICKSCASKDGRRYRHCKLCQRCVKPTWQHCKTCDRCLLPSHKCGQKPKVGNCFKCNKIGHTEKECETHEKASEKKLSKKRKKESENVSPVKKQKSKPLASNSETVQSLESAELDAESEKKPSKLNQESIVNMKLKKKKGVKDLKMSDILTHEKKRSKKLKMIENMKKDEISNVLAGELSYTEIPRKKNKKNKQKM